MRRTGIRGGADWLCGFVPMPARSMEEIITYRAMITVLEPPVATADEAVMADCAGFRVYSANGYEGIVEHVLRDAGGRVTAIGVRSGLFVPRATLRAAAAASTVVGRRYDVVGEEAQ
jgi:hypothetical protein